MNKKLENTVSFDESRTTRNKIAWLTNTRSEITAGVNMLSKFKEKTYKY